MTVLLLTGCQRLSIVLNQVYENLEEKQAILALIEKDKTSEAFEQTMKMLESNQYNSVSMNDIACALLDAGKYEEAVCILQIISRKSPDIDAFTNNLATGYNGMGKYKLGNYYSDLALAVEPNDASEHVNKGNALFGLDKNQEAISAYTLALSKNKGEKFAVYGLAKVYYDLEDYEKSVAYFKDYVEMVPEEASEINYYLCNGLRKLKRFDEAIQLYEADYEKDKTDSSSLYSIADIYYNDLKEENKALSYMEKIIAQDPEDGWAYLTMADYLAGSKRYEEACQHIERALELDGELYYELSYYESFDALKSLNSYQKIIRGDL